MWFAIDVTLEGRAREAVEYALMEAGALGTESSDAPDAVEDSGVLVTAYFDAPQPAATTSTASARATRRTRAW